MITDITYDFGLSDWLGYNPDAYANVDSVASAEKYCELVCNKLMEIYPEADIEVSYHDGDGQTHVAVITRDDDLRTEERTIEYVKFLASELWQEFDDYVVELQL